MFSGVSCRHASSYFFVQLEKRLISWPSLFPTLAAGAPNGIRPLSIQHPQRETPNCMDPFFRRSPHEVEAHDRYGETYHRHDEGHHRHDEEHHMRDEEYHGHDEAHHRYGEAQGGEDEAQAKMDSLPSKRLLLFSILSVGCSGGATEGCLGRGREVEGTFEVPSGRNGIANGLTRLS